MAPGAVAAAVTEGDAGRVGANWDGCKCSRARWPGGFRLCSSMPPASLPTAAASVPRSPEKAARECGSAAAPPPNTPSMSPSAFAGAAAEGCAAPKGAVWPLVANKLATLAADALVGICRRSKSHPSRCPEGAAGMVCGGGTPAAACGGCNAAAAEVLAPPAGMAAEAAREDTAEVSKRARAREAVEVGKAIRLGAALPTLPAPPVPL
mmetsp:Transcript_59652/g.151145  ORF Transcript_59652/g.151145 Transcript_59652/m.151145 type:complete len:208 (-) Transcript_59652:82-705(-)